MPPSRGPAKKTRSRKRKARTEVSLSPSSDSSSSESSGSDSDSVAEPTRSEPVQRDPKSIKKDKLKQKIKPAQILPPETDEVEDEATSTTLTPQKKKKKTKSKSSPVANVSKGNGDEISRKSQATSTTQDMQIQPQQSSHDLERTEFENWYVRTVTQQFADDLSALRSASDFRDTSVPVLVRALRQGAAALLGE